ncbi:solute carrier family 13 member 4-like [Dermacentor silvarum]|uniref:solute carrier family 13 member 4-like n=1 Tax=Dermacentor silvarum TaxID=543639 RepID=UPI002100D3E0|nr:solute carrier family 13 member 4-like [Dermacentor silvarum]
MPPAKKKRGDWKKGDWKQWCRKKCSVRLVLGYVAPLLLTPAAVANSNMVWCLSVGLLMVAWTLLGTVPVPITWLLPFFVLPLAGVTSVSDLADMFMEDSLVILLLGMNLLVAAGEETALCSRVALYVIDAFGLRLRGILLGITGVTFLSAQLLMGGSATLLMCAVVEATMFELQHDLIAATIAHGRRRNVRTTVGEDVVMTPVHVMIISPRKTPSSGSSIDDDDEEDDDTDSSEDDEEGELRPRVLVPSIAPFDARNPGAYYQLHGSVPDDPRYIVGMDAVIPEIDQNADPNAPKKNPILKHRNTSKMFLLEAHRFHKIKKALLINVAHTSAVGCMASILGSTSGIYLRDYFHFTYGYDAVTALSWTLLGLPVATVSVLLCAFITYFLFLRAYDIQEDGDTLKVIAEIIRKKRKFLGKLTCKERILVASIGALFVCCIAIRGVSSLVGLKEQLSIKYAHESVNVMVVVVLLSFLPHGRRTESVLDWRTVSGRIHWRALLSVGGGLSLAGALEFTGLSRRISEKLSSLDFLSPLQTQVVLILLTTLLAEVNTNVVIARFLIPIASDIGVLTNVHPLYYALPVAMASCTPTVLPTAAPSIAVVTSAMDIQVVDILYPGLAVKLSAIILVLATVNTVGVSLFSLSDLPAWAVAKNNLMTGTLANASGAP